MAIRKKSGTARKSALSKEEIRMLQFSVERAAEGILWIEKNGSISFANEALARPLGYERDELLKMKLHDIDPNYTRKEWPKRWENLRKKKEMVVETLHRRKDGTLIPVEVAASFVASGKEERICAYTRDTSERHNVEQALRESESKFRNLAEESPNMIFIYDFERVVYANRKCEEVMGYSRHEMYAPSFDMLDIIAPESREMVGRNMGRHAKGEDIAAYEYALLTKRGDRVDSVINSKLMTFGGKKAILGIVTDISDLKKAENMLSELAHELKTQASSVEQKNVALKEILAQIETEKMQIRKQVTSNVEKFIMPTLNKMKIKASAADKMYIDMIEQSLTDLTTEFGAMLSPEASHLTVREMEICNMIRSGLSNKEMADSLGVSLRTIETHRNNIRKKLGILGKKTQLSAHLQSLK